MNQHLPTHRVSWHIDLPAANVQAAAGLALQIQRDPASTALVFEVERDGETVSVDLTPDVTFGRRSLRPGLEYQTRDGQPVQVLNWDTGEPRGIVIQLPDGSTAWRPKSGRVNPRGEDHPLDVLEVSSAITKWVRVYDRKLNENGKQVVGGKEFAAERGLNWYIFDTEEEARANLQGVRAVFPITYREGEGLG